MERAKTRIAASSLALATLFWAGSAHATGVTAGTLIENTASATYTSGASGGSITSNTVTVKVDELLDVAVAGLTTTPEPISSTNAVLVYSVTNTGNGNEAFNLTANPTVTGNKFDGNIVSIAIDTNKNGVYDAGDVIVTQGGASPSIAPDSSVQVLVIVSVPQGVTDGEQSQVRLIAAAATGTGTAGTVFSGQGQGGGDAVVGTSTAQANALDALVASVATVALAKTAVIDDQFGGHQPVPGATVTYTMVASVSGSGKAENLHVTDVIPTGTTYKANSLKLGGTALTDVADGDAGVGSASGIDVGLGAIDGGQSRTVNFQVTIN
ncbi:DUF11 domain-containing protein [Novosphingobium lentum]|uniref:DUF11 domain-containing protein n=1 Tax=Novosphingobium lentum TaxID=145287 RepID=UPI0008366595|nr:DUF11 domain-containing protein [Novosphingobium lentum]